MSAVGGVQRAAIASALPGSVAGVARGTFEWEDGPAVAADQRPTAIVESVSADFFGTIGVSLDAGRDFDSRDGADGLPVAIVSRQFAAQVPRGGALGHGVRLFTQGFAGKSAVIVGVAPDIVGSRDQEPQAAIYLPHAQAPSSSIWVLLSTTINEASLAPALRDVVRQLDPNLPVLDGPVPVAQRLAGGYRYRAVVAGLFATFAAIALLLACMGLYAVVAQVVQSRSREIGVR